MIYQKKVVPLQQILKRFKSYIHKPKHKTYTLLGTYKFYILMIIIYLQM